MQENFESFGAMDETGQAWSIHRYEHDISTEIWTSNQLSILWETQSWLNK